MGTFKDTLVLPTTEMPIKADLPQKEPAVYASWGNLYERFKRDGKNPFILHDGPPYANGDIHIGHALNKILKDFAVKFQYFNGRAVEFVPGWDCHGLPIEQKVKKDKPDNLRKACREYAAEQVEKQKEQFKSLGVVADWDHPYLTMDPQYEANIFRAVNTLAQKGYLFEGLKPVFWSWAERTALAEAEVEYHDRTDASVFVAFPNWKEETGLLVWTTTPWTLPANVAVAVNPELYYVEAEVYCEQSPPSYPLPLFVAENLVDKLKAKGLIGWEFGRRVQGKDLKFMVEHPLNNTPVPVVCADFVSDKDGTGCVHIAPAHGADDYEVGQKYKLPTPCLVGPDGKFTEGKYEGVNVFEANTLIVCDLQENKNNEWAAGKYVGREEITHSYPHCWRSGKPLIFRATKQWFLNLDKFREDVIKEFESVDFQPEASRNRMRPMLENRPDWCLSRQREWGVPIAFLRNSATQEAMLFPDVAENVAKTFEKEGCGCWWERSHKEFFPNYESVDADKFEKVLDILDVWFDSGFSWHILNGRQADLYLEGNDQHRGWFQSSLWLSVALTGKAPYKKVITHGFVVDGDGKKMAKSKGNVVSPNDVVKRYGAEVLRYWVATTDYTKDVTISEETLKRAQEGHRKLRNTLRYLTANTDYRFDVNVNKDWQGILLLPIDHWMLLTTHATFRRVHKDFAEYNYYQGMQRLMDYVSGELSGIYMNSIKDRLYCDSKNNVHRAGAVFVLKTILEGILPLIAPLFTYTAQEVFEYSPAWLKERYKDVFNMVYAPTLASSPGLGWSEPYWKKALEDFHLHFDALKKEGKIKDTLEVSLETKQNFDGIEEWFVVGHRSDFTNREALTEWGDFRIVKSDLNKCERCWKRNAHENLCDRCKGVVKVLSMGVE